MLLDDPVEIGDAEMGGDGGDGVAPSSAAVAMRAAPLLTEAGGAPGPAVGQQAQSSFASSGMLRHWADDEAAAAVAGTVVVAAPSCCSPGWPQLWSIVVMDTVNVIIVTLSLPDMAAAFFNGGVDPCAGGAGRDAPACQEALGKFANLMTLLGLVSALLNFGLGPLIGAAADRLGTKPLFVASTLAKFVTGDFVASREADIRPLDRRANATRAPQCHLRRLGAAFALEGIVAPLLAVLLTPKSAAMVVLALGCAVLVTAVVCLPGSPSAGATASVRPPACLPGVPRQQRIGQQLRGLLKLFAHPKYRLVVLLSLIGGALEAGFASIWFLYLKEKFGMTLQTMAPILSLTTLSNLVAQIWLIKPLQRRFGLKGVISMAFLSGIVTCTGYLLAPTPGALLLVAVLSGLGGLADPGITAVITNLASADEGELGMTLGAAFSVGSISSIVGPLLFRALFAGGFPGLPFVFAIATDVLAVFVLSRVPSNLFPSVP